MQRLEDTSTSLGMMMGVFGYVLCSSILLFINKIAIEHFRAPFLVAFIQLFLSTMIIVLVKSLGMPVDALEWGKMKSYAFFVVAYVAGMYANMQALATSNVETLIMFRACAPIAVGIVEYLFMDRAWLSLRSSLALACIALGGVIIFYQTDYQPALEYKWVVIYFLLITLEMAYGKKLASSVKMESALGPVFYCNLLGSLLLFSVGYLGGDYVDQDIQMKLKEITFKGLMILLFSSVVVTMFGYTGWLCRGMMSATSFTLLGVVNKFVMMILNVSLWNKQSSTTGLFAACLCLVVGTCCYQQAPRQVGHKLDLGNSLPN